LNSKIVGIIILNWQNWQDTLACLNSLSQLTFQGSLSIIVCDNASQDDSLIRIFQWAQQHYSPQHLGVFTYIKKSPDDVTFLPATTLSPVSSAKEFLPLVIIQITANLGFAGGNNAGIHYALQQNISYEYLWILNNDTLVDVHALTALYEYATRHPQQALIGSTLINYYQPNTVQCTGGCHYYPLLTIFRHAHGGELLTTVQQYDETQLKLDYVAGAAMFLKVTAIMQVGLLNEEYFLFYEELDYTQRLKREGYDIGWCKASLVHHKGSATIGNDQRDKLQRANYYENLSTLKYTANFYPYLLPMVMIIRGILKALALISRGDFYLLLPLLQAYKDFIKHSKSNHPP
jgi:hypothetical protein